MDQDGQPCCRRWAWRFLAALTLTLLTFALSTRITWQPKEVQAAAWDVQGIDLEKGLDKGQNMSEVHEAQELHSEVHEEVQAVQAVQAVHGTEKEVAAEASNATRWEAPSFDLVLQGCEDHLREQHG